MPAWSKRRIYLLFLIFFLLGSVLYFSCTNAEGFRGGVAELDGYYYYIYLRSLQMDGDVDFKNEYREWGNPFAFGPTTTGYHGNVFGIGPAVLWAPFFLATHGVVLLSAKLGLPFSFDGMSRFHQVGTFYGTFVYGFIGIVICFFLARRLIGSGHAVWGTLGAALAGPLPSYMLFNYSSYSHAQAAMSTALLLYLWVIFRESWSLRRWILFGAASGLVILVRPACCPFLLLPMCEACRQLYRESKKSSEILFSKAFAISFAKSFRGPVCGALSALAIFSPQMIAWKIIYGSFFTIPQRSDFMWWSQSAWQATLFSPRNGLFPSAPLYLLAVLGVILFARKKPGLGLPLCAVFLSLVFVNGAVFDWWGWLFSARRYACALPLFTIGLTFLLERARSYLLKHPARAVGGFTAALILLAVVFNLQWVLSFNQHNLRWSSVHSTQARYMTVIHHLVDETYSTVGNPLSWPASLSFAITQKGSLKTFDQIDGACVLGESHPAANPAADPLKHAFLDLGDPEFHSYLSSNFGFPKQSGGVRYAPLREPRGHIFLPINRPGKMQMMIVARAQVPEATLEVLFNDQSLGSRRLPMVKWSKFIYDVPDKLIERGINRLDLRHTFQPPKETAKSRCIDSVGCIKADLAVISGGLNAGRFAEIWLNDKKVSENQRGLNVAVIDPKTGRLLGQSSFDIVIYPGMFRELLRYLRFFPKGSFVAIASRGSVHRHFNRDGVRALAEIGASTDLSKLKDMGYVAIGATGAKAKTALEQFTPQRHARIHLGRPPAPWREIAQYQVIYFR